MSTYSMPHYISGRPYRPLHARHAFPESSVCPEFQLSAFPISAFPHVTLVSTLSWTAFWQQISETLQACGYTEGTRAQYRSILRSFYRHARGLPAATNAALIHEYIVKLTQKNYSWNWVGMNISVLRSVFDKLAGQSITRHFVTPKRRFALPEILSHDETGNLLAAADTTRDQLVLGLLYGCGLKVGELRRLTWADVQSGYLHIRHANGQQRTLEIPSELVDVLEYGKARCPAADYIFQGRYSGTALSTRMIELIVRRAARASDTIKIVTTMTLRHTYAVHCLENHENIRAVQQALGHDNIKTTMIYTHCSLPANIESPLDALRRRQRTASPPPPPSDLPQFQLSAFPISAFPHPLFANPLTVEALELPFSPPEAEKGNRFYQLLKTLITGRFLCRRRSGTRSG